MGIDWRDYHLKGKQEFQVFLDAMDKVAGSVGPPKPEPLGFGKRGRGRPPYSPTAMLKVNLLRMYLKFSYREMASFLAANPELRQRLGLQSVPGHDTIHRHAETLGEKYLATFNDRLAARLKKTRSTSASTPPVSRSRGTRDVGALPRTTSGKAATG